MYMKFVFLRTKLLSKSIVTKAQRIQHNNTVLRKSLSQVHPAMETMDTSSHGNSLTDPLAHTQHSFKDVGQEGTQYDVLDDDSK